MRYDWGMRIGYGRVSTRDQNPDAQEDALRGAGCDEILIDKSSGKLARRPELDKALMVVRSGDQLVITKLDRLGRSLENLLHLSEELQRRRIDLVVLDQGIDTTTALGRMFFQILGAVAEFEHALMSERTMEGLAAARARGRTGGQKSKLTPRQARMAQEMYASGEHTVQQIAEEFGVTRPTIYRHIDKLTGADAVPAWDWTGTIGGFLKSAPSLVPGQWLYVISKPDVVLYIGQANDPVKRLRQHIAAAGTDNHHFWQGDQVTNLIQDNWDEAQGWRIQMATVIGDLDAAEAVLIKTMRPCLNRQHNDEPGELPEHLRIVERERTAARVSKIRNRRSVL